MPSNIAIIMSALGFVGSTLFMTWRMARAAALLEAAMAEQTRESQVIRTRLNILDAIPVMQNDVGNLQIGYAKLASAFPEMKNRVAVMETRVVHLESYRQKTRSIHDDEEES